MNQAKKLSKKESNQINSNVLEPILPDEDYESD